MKQLFFIALALISLSCCTGGQMRKMVQIDSLISRDLDDSAYNALKNINAGSITDEETRAYFNLLKTAVLFKKDAIVQNDSMIDHSILF